MDVEKFNRSIPLQCPTCGCTQFEGLAESVTVKCVSCGRELAEDELIEENSENLQEHADEIAREALPDIGRHLKRSLQDAFRGSKFINIRNYSAPLKR
jgi:uncharacterized Zn finger protein (UPF0148 family)